MFAKRTLKLVQGERKRKFICSFPNRRLISSLQSKDKISARWRSTVTDVVFYRPRMTQDYTDSHRLLHNKISVNPVCSRVLRGHRFHLRQIDRTTVTDDVFYRPRMTQDYTDSHRLLHNKISVNPVCSRVLRGHSLYLRQINSSTVTDDRKKTKN